MKNRQILLKCKKNKLTSIFNEELKKLRNDIKNITLENITKEDLKKVEGLLSFTKELNECMQDITKENFKIIEEFKSKCYGYMLENFKENDRKEN